MKKQIDKYNKLSQQIQYTGPIRENDNVCPQKQDNTVTIIIGMIMSTLVSTFLATSAIVWYFKLRPKEN